MLPFCACTNSDSSFVVFMMQFEIDLASKKSKSLEPCLLVSHLWDGHIFVTWSTDLPTGALSEFNCTTACSISSYYAILQSHSSRCNFDKTGFGIRHNLLHYERLVFQLNFERLYRNKNLTGPFIYVQTDYVVIRGLSCDNGLLPEGRAALFYEST